MKLLMSVSFIAIFVAGPILGEESSNCTILGSMPGVCNVVSNNGNQILIGAGKYLIILDCTDSSNPQRVGFLRTPSTITAIAVKDQKAYIAGVDCYLRIIDLSTPSMPTELGSYENFNKINDIKIYDNFAYLADQQGLSIIDISRLSRPKKVGSYGLYLGATGVEIRGNIAFVTALLSGLVILDLSNPVTPNQIGAGKVSGGSYGLAVKDNLVLIASGKNGLTIFYVGNPANPLKVSSYILDYRTVYGIAVRENTAIVSSHDGFSCIDFSDLANLKEIGSYSQANGGSNTRVALNGDVVYYAAAENGLRIFDISDISSPQFKCVFETPEYNISELAVSGTTVFAVDNSKGLFVFDTSDPASPKEVGLYKRSGISSVVVQGKYAFISGTWVGMQILDISDPSRPIRVGYFDPPTYATDIAVNGNMAYVADEKGLSAVSIANPENPLLMGYYRTGSALSDVEVSGSLVFVTFLSQAFAIFDMYIPSNPKLVNAYNVSIIWGSKHSISVADGIFCAASNGYYAAPGGLTGSFLYIMDYGNWNNLGITDYMGSFFEPTSVALACRKAFVVNNWHELWILDLNDPVKPVELGYCKLSDVGLNSIVVHDNICYLAAKKDGVIIVRFDDTTNGISLLAESPVTFELLNNFPNPFNSETIIEYQVLKNSDLRIVVFNVKGQIVRTLIDRGHKVGNYSIRWDGLDNSNQQVGSGIYFVRLIAEDITKGFKVTLLR